jgi:hypothetical protein
LKTNKGQMFSVDLLIASIVFIIILGFVISSTEEVSYREKEIFISENLKNKADSAFVAISNGVYACDYNGLNLAYTIDTAKLYSDSNTELKKYLGIGDLNAVVSIDGNIIINETLSGNFISVISESILLCKGGIDRNQLNECITGNCELEKKNIIIKVSE